MSVSLDRRRSLRRESTTAEVVLWAHLRDRRFAGFKFRRQHPCGPFILDFYCAKERLAIELDGGQHFTAAGAAYDAQRTHFLTTEGITVLRFPTNLVFTELEGVLNTIAAKLGLVVPAF